jgi:hypothetical protein
MSFQELSMGRSEEVTHLDDIKATLIEGISITIFVFANESLGMDFGNSFINNTEFIFSCKIHNFIVVNVH